MKKFKIHMIEKHYACFEVEAEDIETAKDKHMCALDSLAVGNYNNTKQYLFLKRFCNLWEKVEEREVKMKTIKFTQEEINQLYDALETLPDEIYIECPGTPCDEDKALLSGIEKLKREINFERM